MSKKPWEMTSREFLNYRIKIGRYNEFDMSDRMQIEMWNSQHIREVMNSPRDADIPARVLRELPEPSREVLIKTHPKAQENWINYKFPKSIGVFMRGQTNRRRSRMTSRKELEAAVNKLSTAMAGMSSCTISELIKPEIMKEVVEDMRKQLVAIEKTSKGLSNGIQDVRSRIDRFGEFIKSGSGDKKTYNNAINRISGSLDSILEEIDMLRSYHTKAVDAFERLP